jgi:DNA-binding transcriptional LysR family regulator
MIQIHRLEGFYWVARAGGYARAARAFPYPITQPAVHQQVKKLESELGVALFERVGKDSIQLTVAGQRLFDFAAPFFEGLPGVVRALQGGEYGGTLTIHAAPLFLRKLLPAWLGRLRERRPQVHVDLREMAVPDLGRLRQGEADLVVDHLPEVPDDIATLRVATLRAFVVLPRGHAQAGRKRLALDKLSDDTFIGYSPGTLPHDLQRKALALSDCAPRHTITAGSADTILGFVESGLGFSIVPALEPEGPRGEGLVAVPLAAPRVEFPVFAAWRKDTPENPLLDAALESAPKP